INWGDGNTSSGAVTYDAGTDVYTVSGSHTYADEGAFAVSVSIVDDGGSTASVGLSATVADAALTASAGPAISATEGASTGTVTVATFTDANPGDHTADFTVLITWGDGNTTSGAISYDSGAGTYTVTGSHTYAEEGTYSITVDINDV